MHLGVILPNYGPGSSPHAIRRLAEAAEAHGYDSIWTTTGGRLTLGVGSAAGTSCCGRSGRRA